MSIVVLLGQTTGKKSGSSNVADHDDSSGLQTLSDHWSFSFNPANTRRYDHLSLGPIGTWMSNDQRLSSAHT